jgi:hypothetical protein
MLIDDIDPSEAYFNGDEEYYDEPEFVEQDVPDFEALEDRDYDDYDDDPSWSDSDALASAGFGMNEDYGDFGGWE